MLKIIVILGISLTIIWGYTQARHRYILLDLNKRAKEVFPEYKGTHERRAKEKKWRFSAILLLTYTVPIFVVLIWIALLIFL
jgi:hypothetical protein